MGPCPCLRLDLISSEVRPACSLIKVTSQNIPNSRIMSSSIRPPLATSALNHSENLIVNILWCLVLSHMLKGWFKQMYYGGNGYIPRLVCNASQDSREPYSAITVIPLSLVLYYVEITNHLVSRQPLYPFEYRIFGRIIWMIF